MLARSLSGAVMIALAAPCVAASVDTPPARPAPPLRSFVIAAVTPAPVRDALRTLPRITPTERIREDSPRDRFDVRALRLEPQRRARSPVAGLRLSIRDDMDASLGTTGALRSVIDRPIIE